MAITLDSKAGWSGHNSNAPSWSHTIGSGSNRILIVGYTQYCNGDVIPSGNDVTWTASGQSPQALTLLISENLSTWEGVCCQIYYLLNPNIGSGTIAITDGRWWSSCVSYSYFGVNQDTPFDGDCVYTAGYGGSPLTLSIPITLNYPNEMVFNLIGSAEYSNWGDQWVSDNSGQTDGLDEWGDIPSVEALDACHGCNKLETTSGSKSYSISMNSAGYTLIFALALREGGVSPNQYYLDSKFKQFGVTKGCGIDCVFANRISVVASITTDDTPPTILGKVASPTTDDTPPTIVKKTVSPTTDNASPTIEHIIASVSTALTTDPTIISKVVTLEEFMFGDPIDAVVTLESILSFPTPTSTVPYGLDTILAESSGLQKYESQEVEVDTIYGEIFGDQCFAQTFTAQSDHTISQVKLFLQTTGNLDGFLFIVAIFPTTDGLPDMYNPPLAYAMVDATTLYAPWSWKTFTMITPCNVTSGTTYAIVTEILGGGIGITKEVDWEYNVNAPYAGGEIYRSINSGVTWELFESYDADFLFQIWGEPSEPS